MASKGTTKNKDKATVYDTTVDERTQTAENWWYNLPTAEQDACRDDFKSPYAPTNEEILAAYENTHEADGALKPATAEVARGWWNGLYPDERKALKEKYVDVPPDDVLMTMYDDAHKSAPEQQHTGEEPPTTQPATPYASATNPELMANDAIAGENTALYAGSPIPGGYQPPPPPDPPIP